MDKHYERIYKKKILKVFFIDNLTLWKYKYNFVIYYKKNVYLKLAIYNLSSMLTYFATCAPQMIFSSEEVYFDVFLLWQEYDIIKDIYCKNMYHHIENMIYG